VSSKTRQKRPPIHVLTRRQQFGAMIADEGRRRFAPSQKWNGAGRKSGNPWLVVTPKAASCSRPEISLPRASSRVVP